MAATLAERATQLGRVAGVQLAADVVTGTGRAAEHRAGRRAAREALARAGGTGPVLRAHDGRPTWPPGWTGSIAHAGGWAVAAVGSLAAHRAIGVDLEQDGALRLDDALLVIDDVERTWASIQPDTARAATLIWSAKEAAFKAWSTASGGLIGVDPVDIHVEIDVDRQRLVATAGRSLRTASFRRPLAGRYCCVDAFALTLLTHPA